MVKHVVLTLTGAAQQLSDAIVDEAAAYFDSNIDDLLTEARKYRCGCIFAHQYLDQATSALKSSFAANTTIKQDIQFTSNGRNHVRQDGNGRRRAIELPGLAIAFEVEPLGMLFALIASGLLVFALVFDDFVLAFYSAYKQVAYEVWAAVRKKKPAPQPSYQAAQRIGIADREPRRRPARRGALHAHRPAHRPGRGAGVRGRPGRRADLWPLRRRGPARPRR